MYLLYSCVVFSNTSTYISVSCGKNVGFAVLNLLHTHLISVQYELSLKFLSFSVQIEQKVPASSAGGFVAPPQLPAQGPNVPFGYGVPFSYNIPPANDSAGPACNAAAKPLNTNLQVCTMFHYEQLQM
jgi:hypothetical protein